MIFNKITIIGVGLIGGSIGLAVKRRRVARKVTGVFRRAATMRNALRARAVDEATLDVASGVSGADLIIIAAPVRSIPALAAEAAGYAKRGAIITDVGSTKAWVVGRAEGRMRRLPATFVGSHPMAGSEKTGVANARADLLEGSACIVTRTSNTPGSAVSRVARFWKSLGARVGVMSPSEHDRTVALASHLPHVVAFALALAVPDKALRFAAEGFRDTTRIASSDPALWSDIFLTNRREIAVSARAFRKSCDEILRSINADDRGSMMRSLSAAKRRRDRFMKRYAKRRR